MGVAAGFNVLIIYWKVTQSRFSDAGLDAFILGIMVWAFAGTLGGNIIATVGSAIVSLYLLAFPPKFSSAY